MLFDTNLIIATGDADREGGIPQKGMFQQDNLLASHI